MTIHFQDSVKIRFAGAVIEKKHNTMSQDFFNLVETTLVQGLQNAVSYAYVSPLGMPTQTYIVFLNEGIVEYVATVNVDSASGNSVVLNFYDDSTLSYTFDRIELWAGDSEVLYYPIAHATLSQKVTKTPNGFLEITWTISWVPSTVFYNIPSQLLQSTPVVVYPPVANCNQPFVSALIMALMGLPVNPGACAYSVLAQAFQSLGVNGISYIAFYDSNYNLITYIKGNSGIVTFNTQPSYILVIESAGGVYLPLLAGELTVPLNVGSAYVVQIRFSLTQGTSTSTTGIISTGSSTSTSTGPQCVEVRTPVLHYVCSY